MNELIKQIIEPEVDVISMIHRDFDTAGKELLDKAHEVIAEGTKKLSKKNYAALQQFGFKRVVSVQEHEAAEKAKKIAGEVAEKIMYYALKYPQNKFITKEQVKDICKKYGLVFGRTEWYIGDMPEKNMKDVADFKLDKEDQKAGSDYMIVATKDEFDTKGLRMYDEWELKELPPDPIVLAPVNGGYLIVTVWGPEADLDEIK